MMKNLDTLVQEKSVVVQRIQEAMAANDSTAFQKAFIEYTDILQNAVIAQAEGMIQANDQTILAGRGVRVLTSDERTYYQKVIESTLDAPDQLNLAFNNLKLAGAELGTAIYTALEPMIAKVVEWAQTFSAWFTSLDDGTKQTIVIILGIVAAIAPLLLALGKITSSVGSIIAFVPKITSAFSAIGTAFKGFTSLIGAHPIIAAITAVIAIIALLWTKCEWFRDLVKGLWEWIKTTFNTLVEWIKQAFNSVKDALSKLWEGIKDIVDKIVDVFNSWLDFIKSVFEGAWTTAIESIKGVFTSLWDSISATWENIKGIFNGIITFVKSVFKGDWEGAWNAIVDTFGNIFGAIGNLVKAPINAVISLINGAIKGINKISITIPDWVPALGGKNFGFNIPTIPMLAKGGALLQGMAIVAEAGPELIQQQQGKTIVTPLSGSSANGALGNVGLSDDTIAKLAKAILDAIRGGDGGGALPVIIRLMLDGKVLTEALIDDLLALLGKKQQDITTARG